MLLKTALHTAVSPSAMDPFRGHLLLLMLLSVKAWNNSGGILQTPLGLPTELLDMLKQGSLVPHTTVKEKGRLIKPVSTEPSIPFPLAHPTMDNILAICHYGNLRPRYTKDMLPSDGFGYLYRQATAVNQLESLFTVCCSNGTQDEEMTLCCAQQAWEKSLSVFCEEEFGIMTSHYHCCKKEGPARWDCFKEEAPDQSYTSGHEVPIARPTTIQGFDFNPSSCQKTSVSEITPPPAMETEKETEVGQRLMVPHIPLHLRDEGYHVFNPRSIEPNIPFPPAHPSTTNILAICKYNKQRPQYPKETLPRSGFGYLHRQASAVNQLESWYTLCCANSNQDDNLTLCCAQQAWEKSLSVFCDEEFGIKTNHYHCCRQNGPARWECFEKNAPDTSYQISGHEVLTKHSSAILVFDFDPDRCQKTSISELASRAMTGRLNKTPQVFPPGRPNSLNILSICAFRKHRPRYLTSCLPHTGFDWFAHQLNAINGLERSFGQCCKDKRDIEACAEGKWKKMVDRFCKDEKKIQVNQFECCKKQRGKEQYDCFSTAAPNPDYMVMNDYVPSEAAPNLNMICDTYPALQKMNRLPFTINEMAENCCSLVGSERSACLRTQLDNLLDDACKGDNPSLTRVKQNCCKKNAAGRSKCLTKMLLLKIAVARRINNNRKTCPIIS